MGIIIEPYKPIIITAPSAPCLRKSHLESGRREGILPQGLSLRQLADEQLKAGKIEALLLASLFLAGRIKKDAFEECDRGYKVSSVQAVNSMRSHFDTDYEALDWARLTLAADLRQLGYRVALVAPDPRTYELVNPGFLDEAGQAGIADGDRLFLDAAEDAEDDSLAFPRDCFVQLGSTVHINPMFGQYDWDKLSALGKGLSIGKNELGCGGRLVLSEKFAIMGETYFPFDVPESFKLEEGQKRAEAERALVFSGRRVFKVPSVWCDLFPPSVLDELGTTKRFLYPYDHADTGILYLEREDALFVSEPYYTEFRAVLDPVFDQIRPTTFGVLEEEDGFPINSLPLPNGGVFMDKKAVKAKRIIESSGIRVETTSFPFGTWSWGSGGGIHCATNVLNVLNL